MSWIARGFRRVQFYFTPKNNQESPVGQTDGRTIAFLIGFVAFMLPVSMWVSTFLGNCHYDSISHFYYSRYTGDIFVGSLFFVGGVMLAYTSESRTETWLARFAGCCSFGVALFPTSGTGCEGQTQVFGRGFTKIDTDPSGNVTGGGLDPNAFELFPSVETLHLLFAVGLFAALIVFCFFIFTIVFPGQRDNGGLSPQKIARNWIYCICGTAMLGAALMIAAAKFLDFGPWWEAGNWMFWMEWVMLFGFGLSWMVKGRFQILLKVPFVRTVAWMIAPLIDEGAAAHVEDRKISAV